MNHNVISILARMLCRDAETVMDITCLSRAITAKYPAFRVPELKQEQKTALSHLLEGHDVLATLPTGFGKSLIMYMLPLLMDEIDPTISHICMIVSPLRALMKHQCLELGEKGIPCGCILPMEEMTDAEREILIKGNLKVIWSSPEALLEDKLPWRRLCEKLGSRVCLLAFDEAHCITHWGEEFRPDFARVGELRSLVSQKTQTLILSATLTIQMRDRILSLLYLPSKRIKTVTRQPDRPNIFITFVSDVRREEMPVWLTEYAEMIRTNGLLTEKAIIYCRSIPSTSHVWSYLIDTLGNAAFRDNQKAQANQLIRMFHSKITAATEDRLIRGFAAGSVRCIVATIAFGLGIDVPDVRHVFLYGTPSNSIDAWQMVGRAGRDGAPADAFLYPKFQGKVEPAFHEMVNRCRDGTEECLRRGLLRAVSLHTAVSVADDKERCCSLCDKKKK